MKRLLIVVMMLQAFTSFAQPMTPEEEQEQAKVLAQTASATAQDMEKKREAQIEFFTTLGLIQYGNKVDASGSREIYILRCDNTGVYRHDYLFKEDGQNFEVVLKKRGLIRPQLNKETGTVEQHIMVFNPKDGKNSLVWIPTTKARETAERIKKTGKTLPAEVLPQRARDSDLKEMNFESSF